MKEITWLRNQLNVVNIEMKKALEANNENGKQSFIILQMWGTQLKKRIKSLVLK